jgi:hypothetical protein
LDFIHRAKDYALGTSMANLPGEAATLTCKIRAIRARDDRIGASTDRGRTSSERM